MKAALLALVLTAACAVTAIADPITTTVTGSVTIVPGESRIGPPELGPKASVSLNGTAGFTLSAFGPAIVRCDFGCLPGDTFFLSAGVGILSGTISYQGQTVEFDALGQPNFGSGRVDIVSLPPFVVPPVTTASMVFSSPVLLAGFANVSGFLPGDPQGGPATLSFNFTGAGTATGTYFYDQVDGVDLFRFETLRFDFTDATAPIPEPGTALLLGAGAAAIWVRRRRSAKH